MLGELGYGGPGTPDDVTLVVDKFRFQGRRLARETLRRLVPKNEPAGEEVLESSPVAVLGVMGGSPTHGAAENLARGFGVDLDMFKAPDVFMDSHVADERDPLDARVGAQTMAPVDERDDSAFSKKRRSRQAGVAGAEGKGEAEQAKEELMHGDAGRESASLLEDRPTLVDRRIAALERQATWAQEASKSAQLEEGHADAYIQLDASPTTSVTRSTNESTEPFITLVVDLILAEPTKLTTSKRAKTKAKRKADTKTPRKTNPKNPNAKSQQ